MTLKAWTSLGESIDRPLRTLEFARSGSRTTEHGKGLLFSKPTEGQIDPMKTKTLIAGILIALGIMAFIYQGIISRTRESALDLDPLQVTTQNTRTLPIPPIVGALALTTGVVLLVVANTGRKHGSIAHR